MSEFSPDQKPVRGEDDLWPLARRIAQKTMEVWETHVRKGQAALVESHQESLPKLARAGLTYGEQSISTYLTSRMNEDNPTLRLAATRALGQIATNDMAAVETLLDQLDDEAPSMRHEAAMALGEIGTSDQEIIDRLTTCLENGPPKMRHGAAVALGWIDAETPAVIDALVNGLDDQDTSVRMAAAQALGRMDFDEHSVIQSLVDQLDQPPFEDPSVDQEVAQILGWLGTDKLVKGTLSDRLRKREEDFQRQIAEVLDQGGTFLDVSTSELRGQIKGILHKEHGISERVLEVRDRVVNNWKVKEVITSGVKKPRRFERRKRRYAARVLDQIHPKDLELTYFRGRVIEEELELSEVIASGVVKIDRWVRQAAAEALGRIGRKDSEVIDALVNGLEDEDFMVRSEAAKGLGRSGADSSAVIKALTNCLDDRTYVRRAVVEALGRIGTDSSAVTEALIERLSDENPKVRQAAIKALGRISPDEPQATEALATELSEGTPEERTLAAEALSRLGVQKPQAVRHLIDQVVCQNGTETRRAAEVLAGLHWHTLSEEYVSKNRPGLSERALRRADWSATISVEEGKHAAVHWQALARLPE